MPQRGTSAVSASSFLILSVPAVGDTTEKVCGLYTMRPSMLIKARLPPHTVKPSQVSAASVPFAISTPALRSQSKRYSRGKKLWVRYTSSFRVPSAFIDGKTAMSAISSA